MNELDSAIVWNERLNAVVWQWPDATTECNFRAYGERVLELTKIKRCRNVLFHICQRTVYMEEVRQLFAIHLYPGFQESGVRFLAMVLPENILKKPFFHKVAASNDGVPILKGYFSKLEEAEKWLDKMKYA
ncbi:hypothetical protein GE107_14910 [Cohnella sp. CFH 77786]|uniref:hypothetical protein n=1 Tax=Cohnella sp. CFH 77786 TaxID=2662265 RepID=UPI001C608FDF|nr:hypothetical protein [Cohnella sp. CFH 77786]MBW5447345.1 hypothetical protein [Cohnella sp. CFH 77786]